MRNEQFGVIYVYIVDISALVRLVGWLEGREVWENRLQQSPKVLHDTTKPLMFACPLFREFYDLHRTAKLKGTDWI